MKREWDKSRSLMNEEQEMGRMKRKEKKKRNSEINENIKRDGSR